MTTDRLLDVVYVSYLADTQLLRVAAYPPVNSGAIVDHIASSIAADGPLAAMTAAGLGLRVGLITNGVGDDRLSQRLLDTLDAAGIRHTIAAVSDTRTPQLTVVVDDSDTRTWFASLQRATTELDAVNLHLLSDARLVYVDCYRVLTSAAARAITAAKDAPLLLNLGGDPLDEAIVSASHGRHLAAVLTSLDEADAGRAEGLATVLFERLGPNAAIVTLGRLGALARSGAGTYRSAAPPVAVTHTHGAGAAFSAGYARALLDGAGIEAALRAGCETGAAHCAGAPGLHLVPG